MKVFLLRKWYLPSIIEVLAEIPLAVEILDYAQVTRIVYKIVYDFDNKWVRLLFHDSDLFL